MTGANIRYHLALLEFNGLIEMVGQRNEGRGRPMNVYGLSRRILGDGLDKLAGTLVDVWLEGMGGEEQKASLRSVAERLARTSDGKAPIVKRLGQTVERLNELHYQARWEASAVGPRVILGHCPYEVIISNHPQLCKMDLYLLETMLNSSMIQTAKLQLNDKGLFSCAFLVRVTEEHQDPILNKK
jgi:predicted ArsR family transcriptional regulator